MTGTSVVVSWCRGIFVAVEGSTSDGARPEKREIHFRRLANGDSTAGVGGGGGGERGLAVANGLAIILFSGAEKIALIRDKETAEWRNCVFTVMAAARALCRAPRPAPRAACVTS